MPDGGLFVALYVVVALAVATTGAVAWYRYRREVLHLLREIRDLLAGEDR